MFDHERFRRPVMRKWTKTRRHMGSKPDHAKSLTLGGCEESDLEALDQGQERCWAVRTLMMVADPLRKEHPGAVVHTADPAEKPWARAQRPKRMLMSGHAHVEEGGEDPVPCFPAPGCT